MGYQRVRRRSASSAEVMPVNGSRASLQAQKGKNMQDVWISVKQAAQRTGLSGWSIHRAIELGELRHVRVGGRRSIRLKPEWVDERLQQGAGATLHASGGVE